MPISRAEWIDPRCVPQPLPAARGMGAGSHAQWSRHRFDRRRASGRDDPGRSGSHRQQLRSGYRRARRLSHPRPRRHLPPDRRALRLQAATREGVELLVGQTVTINLQMAPGGVAESVTVTAPDAADRDDHVESWRQHRSAAGVGAAVAGPQLDGARLAGARKPDQRPGRDAGAGQSRRPRVPAQCRRPCR